MSEQPALQQAATSRLVVRAVLRTDTGRVRTENQDFGTYTTPEEEESSGARGRLLVVADGMGGHRGGATASRIAGETVKGEYLDSDSADLAAILHQAVTRANERVFKEAQGNPELRGMGTTMSALAVRNEEAWFAHVGDSRIYMVRAEGIEQLTEDHSLVATMVREGLLSPAEAETHPRRNVLQRSVGVCEEVEIDVRGPIALQDGDVLILCSDGLHGLVKAEEMRDVARLPIEEAAVEFVQRALDRGAPDNVTVIVARAERQALDPADETVIETARRRREVSMQEASPDVVTERTSVTPRIVAPAARPDQEPAAGAGSAVAPDHVSGGFVRWLVILALVLGSAGAWFYWQSQPHAGNAPHRQP